MRRLMLKIKSYFDNKSNYQARALANILRFFSVMLLLTLLAKGISGAVMPIVDVDTAKRKELVESINADGKIVYGALEAMPMVQGLNIISVLVREGEKVSEGQVLATVDGHKLAAELDMAKAELRKLETQKAQLFINNKVKAEGIAFAQETLNEAYAAYDKAKESGSEDAIEAALSQARQAEYARNEAIAAYESAINENKIKAEINKAEADVLEQNIKAKKERIMQLTQVLAADNCVKAIKGGTLQGLSLAVGGITPQYCNIANDSIGYILNVKTGKEKADKINIGTIISVKQGACEAKVKIDNIKTDGDDIILNASLPKALNWALGNAECNIELARASYELCLPTKAIMQDNKGSFVYVIEQKQTVLGVCNTAVRRDVTVLYTQNGYSAVSGTIMPQDKVAVLSTRILSVGARVRINV